MEHVGLLTIVAAKVRELSAGNFFIALSIILWVSAFGSSIVDNVPFAATMAPILKHMSEAFGFPSPPAGLVHRPGHRYRGEWNPDRRFGQRGCGCDL